MAFPLSAFSQAESEKDAPFVSGITFIGNDNVSSKELKRHMRTRVPSFFAILNKPRLDEYILRRDIAQLQGLYHASGFFEAHVALQHLNYSNDGRYVDIVIQIVEGEPTVVQSVVFSGGNLLIGRKELSDGLLLHEGEPYNASLLKTDVYKIKAKYFSRGYLGVVLRDSVRITRRTVVISYFVEPGTQIYLKNINVSGLVNVKRSVVDKEFTIHSRDVCRMEKVLETQRNLFETGLFTIVDFTPENLDPLERTVDLSLRLRERKPAYIEGGFGVGNIVGSRVFTEWGTRNLLGTGRTLRVRAEYTYDIFRGDEIDFGQLQLNNTFYRYDIRFLQRRVFGTKLRFGVETFLERDATVDELVVETLGASVGAARRFGKRVETSTRFAVERIERQVFERPSEQSNSHIVTASASHDLRDFIFNPLDGSYKLARASVAGGILGGDNDFYIVSGSYHKYHRFAGRLVLAWRLRSGVARPYGGSATVPIENRFFLGGGNSVRGYRQNSVGPQSLDDKGGDVAVGGDFLLLSNVELRHPVPILSNWNISGALFFDGGNTWRRPSKVRASQFKVFVDEKDITDEDYRYGVGFGLRYNTPIGPLRFDYGVPLKGDSVTGRSPRLHLSLGQIF